MNKSLKIAIGADHAGFLLKEKIKQHLALKMSVRDFGCFSEERADYADFAHPVAKAVENGEADFGILTCGSGNGINMAANKHRGIRSALCWKRELAELARLHNDANILALPARFISETEALEMVDIFLTTAFEGGRHTDRVKKISC
jgi:ribose 5-phosphate isomerase B